MQHGHSLADACSDACPSTEASLRALREVRDNLETILSVDENWRALQQLLARESAGEWIDAVESDVLRARLTAALAAQPAFMAWQFVDAARACLEAAMVSSNASAVATPIDAAFYPVEPMDAAITSVVTTVAPSTPSGAGNATDAATAPAQVLATRIPTLQAHERRASTFKTIGHRLAAIEAPTDDYTHRVAQARDADDTRFQREAVGLSEADVEIVVRQPQKQLLDARLPPLPFATRTADSRAGNVRMHRAAAVKWVDPKENADPDYRPVGSAMDEAQVAIIVTGEKSEAQSRAERRALGIAPDREGHMRRFLSALSGD